VVKVDPRRKTLSWDSPEGQEDQEVASRKGAEARGKWQTKDASRKWNDSDEAA